MSTGLKIALLAGAFIIGVIIIAVLIWYYTQQYPNDIINNAPGLPPCSDDNTTKCIPNRKTTPTSNATGVTTGTDDAGRPTQTTHYEDGSYTVVTDVGNGVYSTVHYGPNGEPL